MNDILVVDVDLCVSVGIVMSEVCCMVEGGTNGVGDGLIVNCVGQLFSFNTIILG